MKIEIHQFNEYHKNTLQGFFTIFLPESGMVIPGFSLHQNEKSRWIDSAGQIRQSL